MRYHIVRGTLDALGAVGPSNTNKLPRNVSRSKYGVKKPKKGAAAAAARQEEITPFNLNRTTMARRRRAEKRQIIPDSRYESQVVGRLISAIMQRGKKSLAQRIVYGAIDSVNETEQGRRSARHPATRRSRT